MTTENDSGAPDVIIVGGGVIGCAIAYHLAADHHVRSLIIERNGIGSEASGGAAGELVAGELAKHSDHAPIDVFTRFLQAGVALHANTAPALLEESGTDYLLADLPLLRPAFTDAEAEALHDEVTELNDAGIAAEWVERETILSMRTWIADDVVGAIYSTEQQVESYPFALALAQACEQHGVEIRTGDVTGIERSGSRVTGVRMGPETLSAQIVIIANGPWAQHTSEWIGLDVAVIPLRGQIVHLDLPRATRPPRYAIFHDSGYLLPKASGALFAGTTIEDVGFDKTPTQDARDSIMEAVIRLAPQVIDIPIKDVSACLRPYSTDDLPIIGAVPGIDGLFMATGHGFKGITLCLVTGKNLAEFIVTGESSFALDAFAPSRLAKRA